MKSVTEVNRHENGQARVAPVPIQRVKAQRPAGCQVDDQDATGRPR